MATIKAMRLASVVTAINVLVATGFSIAAIINPQYLVRTQLWPLHPSVMIRRRASTG
jgi:hypothetical protein